MGRELLAEQTRVVGGRLLLGLNLRDLPLDHSQLAPDTSQLPLQGAASYIFGGLASGVRFFYHPEVNSIRIMAWKPLSS